MSEELDHPHILPTQDPLQILEVPCHPDRFDRPMLRLVV